MIGAAILAARPSRNRMTFIPAAPNAPLNIRPVSGRADLLAFIRAPGQFYAGATGFSEPLEFERLATHDSRKATFFRHGQTQYFLASRGARVVGRIAAIRDEWTREIHGPDTGFFGFFDCLEDEEAAHGLLAAASAWVKAAGGREIRGPFSHSINEETGLMISGFDERPVLMMPYHPPFLGPMVENFGFTKIMDIEAYDYPTGAAGFRKRIESAQKAGINIRTLRSEDYPAEIRTIVEIFNDAWSRNWGFVPFAEAEIAHLAESLKPILVPELVLFAKIGGKPVAMAVTLPNIAEIARDFHGKLLPFNWVRLLTGLRKNGVASARVPLMGLRQEFQNTMLGMGALLGLFATLDNNLAMRGIRNVELSWILETNDPMQRLLRVLNARKYKIWRIYSKPL